MEEITFNPMEKEIVEYYVIACMSLAVLLQDVTKAIAEGWQPLGGVAIRPETIWFYQTMVKYKKQ